MIYVAVFHILLKRVTFAQTARPINTLVQLLRIPAVLPRGLHLGAITLIIIAYLAISLIPPSVIATLSGVVVLVGAGDIAVCSGRGDFATAALLDIIDGTVFTLGDNAYPSGTTTEFACYDSSWGRNKARTRPAPGNHDYVTSGARAYFEYFGAAAGDPRRGYYSYDLG